MDYSKEEMCSKGAGCMEDNIRINTDDLLYIAAKLADLAIELEDLGFRVRRVCMKLPASMEEMTLLSLLRERQKLNDAMERALYLRWLLKHEVYSNFELGQEMLCTDMDSGLQTGIRYEYFQKRYIK